MSDDEADPELLELLRQHLGLGRRNNEDEVSGDTGVLKDAEYIYNNAIDVSIDMYGTKDAATNIYQAMQERSYSTDTWSQHELHPKTSEGFSDVEIVNFIFTMDLVNFSFWSELTETDRYQVDYRAQRWTGYLSLVACLRRALEEGVPVTTPRYWRSRDASDEKMRQVFRSATREEMPLLRERLDVLREAADVLQKSFGDPEEEPEDENDNVSSVAQPDDTLQEEAEADMNDATTETTIASEPVVHGEQPEAGVGDDVPSPSATIPDTAAKPSTNDTPLETEVRVEAGATDLTVSDPQPASDKAMRPDHSVIRLIQMAEHSAGKLVNLLAKHFPCFRDETRFDGKKVRLLKRAQIFVADLWAAFNGTGYGEFHDIEHLTMFADYRVPQMLHSLGVLAYSPPLHYRIQDQKEIPCGHSWEVQLRGCSIWAVELMRREMVRRHPESGRVNAVLIDFFLYDLAKEREGVRGGLGVPHHRTRSIWY